MRKYIKIDKRISISAEAHWILALGIGIERSLSSNSYMIILPFTIIGIEINKKRKENSYYKS
tara:strand:+ start:10575 stop:10760 length:186 start_codon:yes stop_codon:yes gene_type:complete